MDHFAGLDVSVKETSVCILDDAGKILKEVKVASEPQALLHAVIVLTREAMNSRRLMGFPSTKRYTLPYYSCVVHCAARTWRHQGLRLTAASTTVRMPGARLIRRSAGGCSMVTTWMMLSEAFSAATWRSSTAFARTRQSVSGARPLSIAATVYERAP